MLSCSCGATTTCYPVAVKPTQHIILSLWSKHNTLSYSCGAKPTCYFVAVEQIQLVLTITQNDVILWFLGSLEELPPPPLPLTCCPGSTWVASASVHSPGSCGCQRRQRLDTASYTGSSVPIATRQMTTGGRDKYVIRLDGWNLYYIYLFCSQFIVFCDLSLSVNLIIYPEEVEVVVIVPSGVTYIYNHPMTMMTVPRGPTQESDNTAEWSMCRHLLAVWWTFLVWTKRTPEKGKYIAN